MANRTFTKKYVQNLKRQIEDAKWLVTRVSSDRDVQVQGLQSDRANTQRHVETLGTSAGAHWVRAVKDVAYLR